MIGVLDFIDETGGMTVTSSDIGLTLKIQKTVNKICHRLSIFECLGVLIYSNVIIAMQCILYKANLTFRSVFI